jgi:MerR family copper efflux transcriptional regulator
MLRAGGAQARTQMTIGQLAQRAGVNVETVRYYERRGLLPEPARTSSGYRSYDPETLARLLFIKRAQRLGFTLHEVEDLLALRVRDPDTCEAVGHKTREKVALVRQKIRELGAMERSLARLAAACEARRPTGECPILDALEGRRGA